MSGSNVEVKLIDDSTGGETVITVPGPRQVDDNELEIDVDTIARLALSIRKQRLCGKTSDEVRAMYPEFVDQYPVLTEKCCDVAFPLAKLEFLLDQLHAMRTAGVTKDSATDRVMEDLNHTYVDGVVDQLEKQRLAQEKDEYDAKDARRKLRERLNEARAKRTNNI